ncbi:MAG: hypothetical protein IH957_11730 [Chloroflexi bacterium]|nr:hypothetical protein [Chloroflexota bacterium]
MFNFRIILAPVIVLILLTLSVTSVTGPPTPAEASTLPDLSIVAMYGDSRAWPGEEIIHRVVVENVGADAAPTTAMRIELLYWGGGVLGNYEYVPVGDFSVPALDPGQRAIVPYTATTSAERDPYEGAHSRSQYAIVTIDPDGQIAEVSEANNTDFRTVHMSSLPYDVNGGGRVGGDDVQIVRFQQQTTPGSLEWNPDADINGDGLVDDTDVEAVRAHVGDAGGQGEPHLSVSPNSGTVPLTVTFDYEAHFYDGTISQVEIDFEGDGVWDLAIPGGTSTIDGTTQHTVSTAGIYEPTIRSTDSNGTETIRTTELTVAPNLSLAQLIDNDDRDGIEAWSAVRTIAEINTAVAALDSAHRDDLAEVLLDTNATASVRSTLLAVMQDVLSQPELGFFAEIWSYTYIEMVGGGFFGGCGHLSLDPGAYGGLSYGSARGVLIHESFHSFNCVNSGPSYALDEGSATWVGQAVYSNPLLPGQSFAETTYGTKLYYRDIQGSSNYPLKVADDPSDKVIEIFTWLSSQDPSGLPWNSQNRLTHCYESYWESLDRAVDFYTVWLPAAQEASAAMQADPLCQPLATLAAPPVTGFQIDASTATTMHLSWEPVSGAASYERCVSNLPHTQNWICVNIGDITSQTTEVPTIAGVAFFAVRAVAPDGGKGPLSNRGSVAIIDSIVDGVTYHSYHTAYKDPTETKRINSFNLGVTGRYLGFGNFDQTDVGWVEPGNKLHASAQPWTDADVLTIYGPAIVAIESPDVSLQPQKSVGISTLCMVIDEALCTVASPPVTVPVDTDADGFSNIVELAIGTDPLDACPDDTSDDAWPPDMNNDGMVDLSNDILAVILLAGEPDWNVAKRADLDGDGAITDADVDIVIAHYAETCSNEIPRITDLTIDAGSASSATLSWSAVPGVAGYERCVNNLPHTTTWTCTAIGNVTTTAIDVPDTQRVDYVAVRVVALDGLTGALSNRGTVTRLDITEEGVVYNSYHTTYKDSNGDKQINSFNLGGSNRHLGFGNLVDPADTAEVAPGTARGAQTWYAPDLLSIYGPVIVAIESPNSLLSPQKWVGLSTLCMVIDEEFCP